MCVCVCVVCVVCVCVKLTKNINGTIKLLYMKETSMVSYDT